MTDLKNDTSEKKYKLQFIIVTVVLAAAIIVLAFLPNLFTAEEESAALTAQTPDKTAAPATITPEPKPTERAAYIPDIDELGTVPAFETLSLIDDFLKAEIDEEGTLSLNWNQSSEVDYYLLYALDENDDILQTEILWANTNDWSFQDYSGAKVLLIGYKDMGEDGINDDKVVFSFIRLIKPQPLETPPAETPESTATPKPTPKQTSEPKPPAKPNKYYIIVDKSKYTFAVFEYEEETGKYSKRVKQFPCALGGKATPSGKFKIGTKGEWKTWSSTSFSPYHTRYKSGLYFHGPLYSIKGDFSSLKAYSYNQIGTDASHGCIRTTVAGALWVYKNCKAGTVVEIVKSSDRVSKDTKPAIDPDFPTWDPTDPKKPEKPKSTPEPAPEAPPTSEPTHSPEPTDDGGDGGSEGDGGEE